jgi:hypothetical protein
MLASVVVYASESREDTGSFRIPIAGQFVWALVLGVGLLLLPDSPRYHVKRGNIKKATRALEILRSQPQNSHYVQVELAEIIANEEYERSIMPDSGWLSSWANCFRGGLGKQSSNLRKTLLGVIMNMMQQW